MEQRPAGGEDQAQRLKRLGDRLRDIETRDEGEKRAEAASERDMSGLAKGLRISTEFAGGVLVGVGLGWACDRFLGTAPWGLILFMLLGFAAGMMNVMRSAAAFGPRPPDGPGT
jgi:ATP synthase protein I